MQNSQLNRVINLLKRTGDKTVIMDNESDAVMMLMDLGAYEKMLERSQGVEKLTEEELLEKINRDVAVWRAYNEKEQAETYEEVVEKYPEVKPVMPTRMPEAEKPVVNAVAVENEVVTVNKYPNINAEQEQSATDILAEDEEEKFYLEPVE